MNTNVKFKVVINWYGENHNYWLWASNEKRALGLAIYRLNSETGINLSTIRSRIKNGSDCYTVKEVNSESTT